MASKREQCKEIASLDYIKCTWSSEWGEFRVTLDGLSKEREEDVAYYTWDFEDALGTAKAMSEHRQAQLDAQQGQFDPGGRW